MDPVLCLLPSPLLGPACWRPVAERLSAAGWKVAEVPHPPAAPRTAADVLGTFLAAVPPDRDTVLIPHSNAGLFVPAISAERRVAGYVFVDAGLPGGAGRVPMMPAEFRSVLAGKADREGMLPPWSQWWEEEVAALFPDAAVRSEVEREQHRLPLSYFEGSVLVPEGWPDRPGAYLAFGHTYAAEHAAAAALGWPLRTLPGEHLHMLVDPARVATTIADLVNEITVRSPLPSAGERIGSRRLHHGYRHLPAHVLDRPAGPAPRCRSHPRETRSRARGVCPRGGPPFPRCGDSGIQPACRADRVLRHAEPRAGTTELRDRAASGAGCE